MKTVTGILTALAATGALLTTPLLAQDSEPAPPPSPGQIVAAAPAAEWSAISADDLMIMTLAPDEDGNERRIVIQLMPTPFSQGWIRNMRALADARWWDGTSVNRVQDNYVVQWGGFIDEDTEKPLPDGLETMTEAEYTRSWRQLNVRGNTPDGRSVIVQDGYGMGTFLNGWPVGTMQAAGGETMYWPVHCYGMVGVGRNYAPDTGSGAELYTVIGHAPRHLDRNIALVGRIIEGMEHLSSLPRGIGDLGFYESAEERVPIVSIRQATTLPEAQRPRYEMLDTSSDSFQAYAEARTNRRDPFFNVPAGGADLCNIPVPIRPVVD